MLDGELQPNENKNVFDLPLDDSNDMNLCSGRPVGAVTTLGNGTIVVFRGKWQEKYVGHKPSQGECV